MSKLFAAASHRATTAAEMRNGHAAIGLASGPSVSHEKRAVQGARAPTRCSANDTTLADSWGTGTGHASDAPGQVRSTPNAAGCRLSARACHRPAAPRATCRRRHENCWLDAPSGAESAGSVLWIQGAKEIRARPWLVLGPKDSGDRWSGPMPEPTSEGTGGRPTAGRGAAKGLGASAGIGGSRWGRTRTAGSPPGSCGRALEACGI